MRATGMSAIVDGELKGKYTAMITARRGRRLWHELRIDEYGGYSSWFLVEVYAYGDPEIKEFTGLAAAVRYFNRGLEGR